MIEPDSDASPPREAPRSARTADDQLRRVAAGGVEEARGDRPERGRELLVASRADWERDKRGPGERKAQQRRRVGPAAAIAAGKQPTGSA